MERIVQTSETSMALGVGAYANRSMISISGEGTPKGRGIFSAWDQWCVPWLQACNPMRWET